MYMLRHCIQLCCFRVCVSHGLKTLDFWFKVFECDRERDVVERTTWHGIDRPVEECEDTRVSGKARSDFEEGHVFLFEDERQLDHVSIERDHWLHVLNTQRDLTEAFFCGRCGGGSVH